MYTYYVASAIYYGSYALIPLVVISAVFAIKITQHKYRIPFALLCAFFMLGIYVRFIEPQILITQYETIRFSGEQNNLTQEVSIAVFSDPHLGLYQKPYFLKKIVNTINENHPDVVLIPGDFIYKITKQQLNTYFSQLAEINAPVYAVTGNHDAMRPGEFSSDEVRAAVSQYGVTFVDNTSSTIQINGEKIHLYGLSDLWEGKMDQAEIQQIKEEEHSILVIHNPDTVYKLENTNMDLILAGHTHGGQVRIPWLYKKIIPTKYDFDRDWYDIGNSKLFITSGTGEVGLPIRFLIPPEVVIIRAEIPITEDK
ncbi:MAG: hypothetical protein COU30_02810 [Candidatus Magasanikbacteria bacterium CG10_big_fil_rev_8_21_14_0_10_38_6]|uniref:Calcineurin-like phosphoesterase domain-containing protein n=1 Tax=Candidatus Magasanikbacteria bacterium CG10_big_fil_rev_8_21_14_0_10_38_6 TaxID=1974647 RepID=A0A2M6P124_9BACT|nr:MAG: hypothetical protein COU30_02810 [Candidatus Magasanikbacteria bacterium CG10_big_fil_rev_8_21_14_0_10_38_6]